MWKFNIYIYLCLIVTLSATQLPNKQYLEKFCFDCHADGVDKGGIDFDVLLDKKSDHKNWAKVWEVIDKEQMPPADKKKQPTEQERTLMLLDIEKAVFNIDRIKEYSNTLSVYRLSKSQFSNSLQYAFGYEGNASLMMPTDGTSMGFNNISSNLNVSPLHFESYRNLAFAVSREMFKESSDNKKAKESGEKWLEKLGDASTEQVDGLLREITMKAFRRPASNNELAGFKKVFSKVKTESDSNRKALMETFRAIILSPSHIFRTELFGTADSKNSLLELDEFALASRISFFLWNAPPNDELLQAAREGRVRNNVEAIVRRMVDSSSFNNFTRDFVQQWLNIEHLESKELSNRKRGTIRSFKEETTAFVRYLFVEDRPLSEMFTSRVSFVNKHLANRYKLDKVPDKGFHKVTFPEDSHRKGILAHPSILYATSNPDHTSPVKRGLWLLESILGMPPPPAPANVPQIEEAKKANAEKKLTHIELLALHRADKKCASCHEMMDPLGIAMENFSRMGEWREESEGEKIVLDEVWRGHKINSFNDLQNLIAVKFQGKFTKCLTEKLMIYALSRGLDIKDQISVLKIAEKLKGKNPTFQDVLIEVVKSTPFQYRSAGEQDD